MAKMTSPAAAARPLQALLVLAAAAAALGQMMQPLPPLQPLQPLQPGQPMQPLPPLPGMPPMAPMAMGPGGVSASASAASTGPGAASSWAANNNGQGAMGTSASGGGVATASTSGPSGSGCYTVSQSTAGACQSGPCCSTAHRVERCGSTTRAVATINGAEAQCCVVLLRTSDNNPQMFCASPWTAYGFSQMPGNVNVELHPSCHSSLEGSGAGSLGCTVAFPDGLPGGYTYPQGYTQQAPLTMWADKPYAGFKPGNNGGRFKRHTQFVSQASPLVLSSMCE